ncbi:Structural maintenance of chromosomes protein 5 [Ascosphaera aggregata]|nr:Structural maintenance of chromosomes protein 5 [Ascosphaera aggregata]
MLCSESNLHTTPVTLREMSDAEYKTLESHQKISSWVSASNIYSVVRRREYGSNASSTRVKQIQRARWWTNQPVESRTKIQLEESISRAREESTEIERTLEDASEKGRHLLSEIKELRSRERTIKSEKEQKQKAAMLYRGLPEKKDITSLTRSKYAANFESKLQGAENAGRELRRALNKIRTKQDRLALEQVEATIQYSECIRPLRQALEEMFEIEIKLQEARSDYETLNARNQEVNDKLAEKAQLAEQAHAEFVQMNRDRRTLKRRVEELQREISGAPEEAGLREIAAEIQNYTPAELDGAIDSEKAKLDLISEGSTDIIEEYEVRQIRINRLKTQIEEEKTVLAAVDEAIGATRSRWEPELEALVAQISSAFSDSFARIGCAGQVTIDKPEDSEEGEATGNRGSNAFSREENGSGSDFDRWSIQIMVKFRESEPLSILDAHRQSGGERAVSTIFYLMALQSISKSPFRVVDEINQGMDPRNERMVHERMVDIACNEAEVTGRQYFLITPKLLTNLAYREGMQVSCVLSGEFMPAEHEKMSAARCLEKMSSFLQRRGVPIR